MFTPVNPYVTLVELVEELKMKHDEVLANVGIQEELLRAIENASRWVDDYTGRDFFYHNHLVTALVLDEHDAVYDDEIFPQHRPVIRITELKVGTDVLVENTGFIIKDADANKADRIISLVGFWAPSRSSGRTISIKGEFGYRQTSVWPVTEAGDTGSQMSNWSLRNLSGAVIYWGLTSLGGNSVRVDVWSDSAHSNRIATGSGTQPGTIALVQDNSSGVSGTVDVAGTTTDTDTGNTLTPGTPTVATSEVPQGVPGHIRHATRLVAAVFSGHHRKEVAGIDGTKMEIHTNTIPKTVFDLLGKRAPVYL